MDFKFQYKNIYEIASDCNVGKTKNSNFSASNKMFTYYDVFLIYNDEKLTSIVCCDKDFLYSLETIIKNGKQSKSFKRFTNLCRCYIIDYQEIEKLLGFQEFCNRYGYQLIVGGK